MSKDIECPYCGQEQNINHDDGFGYEEGVKHEMECEACDKYFTFETSISFYYEPYKADCLNGSDHNYKLNYTYPSQWTKMECQDCGATRDLTEEESDVLRKNDKELPF